MKKKILLALLGSLYAITVAAQMVHDLNNQIAQGTGLRGANISVPQDFFRDTKISRTFSMNPALQNANSVSVGDIINLQLFEGKSYTATVSKITTNKNGNFTITLKLPDFPLAFGFITTNIQGKSLFTVSIPELNQKFESRGNIDSQTDFLVEIEEDVDKGTLHDEREIPTETLDKKVGTPDMQLQGVQKDFQLICTRDNTLSDTDPATIDVLIVYTPAAKSWADANQNGIANTITLAESIAQGVLDNQGNGDIIRFVHSELISYTESSATSLNTDLDRLTLYDGYIDEVHQIRKQHHADLVVLMGAYSGSTAGISWVLNNSVNGTYNYGFSVVSVRSAGTSTTLIHEIGHNMGMRHEIEQYPTPLGFTPLYPYAWGWHWLGSDNQRYGSVMSYQGRQTSFYSNPSKNYMGFPTGTTNANNAQVFRNTKHIVAFYSDKVAMLPDIPTNLVVSNPTNNGATFSWDDCEGATGYRFNLRTGPNSWTYWFATTPPYVLNRSDIFVPCTSYEVWISAQNECGDDIRSQVITFTTRCTTDPTVTTSAATNITHNSATLNRTVTPNGSAITAQGFMYKVLTGGAWQQNTNGNLTGLAPNTTYKFYAYGTNALGSTINGSVLTFTTTTLPQTLETLMVALNAGNNKVTVQPQATVAGHSFYYSISTAPAPTPSQGNAIGTITGATVYNSAVDVIRANGATLYIQVYKVETVGNTIVGFGQANATPNGKQGDIDGNSDVNAADLSILLFNFGKSGNAITNPATDIDGNGDINAADLSILLFNFGK